MCWISKELKKSTDYSVRVYKVLKYNSGRLLSPFYFMEWELGELYFSDLHIEYTYHEHRITEGLHSFATLEAAVKFLNECITDTDLINPKLIIAEAVVPKDAVCFINDENEVVSNKLRILDTFLE